MALLTDGDPNDNDALRVYETSILDVAQTETIDLQAKLGLATDEISEQVLDLLLDHARTFDSQAIRRREIGVSDVVVTLPLKRWHALHTLAIIYRDAYNNQLNDRYRPKWDEYRKLARSAWDQTIRYGVGLVSSPIPRAPVPNLSTVAGSLAAATYNVQVSWVAATGQEGSSSGVATFTTTNNSLLVVQTLNPPAVATGWNVYIGLTNSVLTLQNSTTIGLQQRFTVPSSGLINGRAAGDGQSPDIYVTGGRMLRRG